MVRKLANDRSLFQRSFDDYDRVMAHSPTDRRHARGAQTRHEVLQASADIASVRGIEALTLSALSEGLQMSKSGIVKHFGSREQLKLATVEYAGTLFADVVLAGVQDQEAGLSRLRHTLDNWLDYLTGDTFAGGCFFHAAAAELDSQPGPLRDLVFGMVTTGLALLGGDIRTAIDRGEINSDIDVDQLLFELHGCLLEVSFAHLLLHDPAARTRGARAISSLLERHTPVRHGPGRLDPGVQRGI